MDVLRFFQFLVMSDNPYGVSQMADHLKALTILGPKIAQNFKDSDYDCHHVWDNVRSANLWSSIWFENVDTIYVGYSTLAQSLKRFIPEEFHEKIRDFP